MPKTILKIQTFMCPLGIGDPNAECRYHVAVDNPNRSCPIHKLLLEKTTDPLDQITVTIAGEDEIDAIISRDFNHLRTQQKDTKRAELTNKIRNDIIRFKKLEHN